MEAYPTSLKQYIDEKGADITNLESLRFCAGISRGLLFLWNHKIVHRDIKLDNILLSSDNIPAICDFGMAITVDDTRKRKVWEKAGGNDSHLAPEVHNAFAAKGKENEAIIDYSGQASWELGVLCYEIAVGQHPFEEYPTGFPNAPNLEVPALNIEALEEMKFPPQFIQLLVKLVHNDPQERIDLVAASEILNKI